MSNTVLAKKLGPLLCLHYFCLHLENALTTFCDFWHTSMPFYS